MITRLFVLIVFTFTLSGCLPWPNVAKPPSCPMVTLIQDPPLFGDTRVQSSIVNFSGKCGYKRKKTALELSLSLVFEVKRKNSNAAFSHNQGYYVAIPKFYPNPMGKRIFSFPIKFAANEKRVRASDRVRITIPLKVGTPIDEYVIYVGLSTSSSRNYR